MTTTRTKSKPAKPAESVESAESATVSNAFQEAIANVDTSYLKIDDTIYTLSKISTSGLAIEQELRDFYNRKYEAVHKQLHNSLVAEMVSERDRVLEHIRSKQSKHNITIPSTLYGKPVIYIEGARDLCACRLVRYNPTIVIGSLSYATDHPTITRDLIREKLGYSESQHAMLCEDTYLKFEIANDKLDIPILLAYSKKQDTLYSPFIRTYHAYSDSKICTGNNTASQWWNLSDPVLEYNFNIINIDSPATRVCTRGYSTDDLESGIRLRDLFNEDTIIRATVIDRLSHTAADVLPGGETWTV